MSGQKYRATDKQREAQRRIAYTCDCGRTINGRVGWTSHLRANPTHSLVAEVRRDNDS